MMISNPCARPVALCFFVLTLLTPIACKSAGGEGSGQSAASRQLTGRGVDEMGDGGENVGHVSIQRHRKYC